MLAIGTQYWLPGAPLSFFDFPPSLVLLPPLSGSLLVLWASMRLDFTIPTINPLKDLCWHQISSLGELFGWLFPKSNLNIWPVKYQFEPETFIFSDYGTIPIDNGWPWVQVINEEWFCKLPIIHCNYEHSKCTDIPDECKVLVPLQVVRYYSQSFDAEALNTLFARRNQRIHR
jgi:hypothetical protein